ELVAARNLVYNDTSLCAYCGHTGHAALTCRKALEVNWTPGSPRSFDKVREFGRGSGPQPRFGNGHHGGKGGGAYYNAGGRGGGGEYGGSGGGQHNGGGGRGGAGTGSGDARLSDGNGAPRMMLLGNRNSMADMLRCDRIFALAPQSPEIRVDMIYIDTGATDHVFGNCKGAVHIAPATNANRVTCFDAGGNAHATQSIMTYQGTPVDTDRPICVENVHGTAAIFDSHPRLVTADGTVYPLTKWEGLFVLFITSANRVLTELEKGLSVEHGQATPTPFAHPLLGFGLKPRVLKAVLFSSK
ncbi:hypothetical protein M885DRAFT_578612, partial [Pelagophyceae sp. CCMP2097]